MKILSLFDGMSCGRIALERAGLDVDKYYSSEIDKYAIQVSRTNYPEIIQLGCVRTVRKMVEAGVFGHIDLLIGGSPCQGFSFAGKELAFNDPRSALFFEFVAILKILRQNNPDIKFLLENVQMKKDNLMIISQFLGVEPILINSNLVSAQNRKRFYWANWGFDQPIDKNSLLKNIVDESKNYKWKMLEIRNKNFGGVNMTKNGLRPYKNDCRKSSYSEIATIGFDDTKSAAVIAAHAPKYSGGAIRGRYVSGNSGETEQKLEKSIDEKSNALTGVKKDSVLISVETFKYRELSPLECERLQTVPDNYTHDVSNNQRRKMLGNGWTVDVIAHILRCLND